MKKRPVKLIAIILCLLMSLSFCGCGKELTSVMALKKCSDAMTEVNSFSFDLESDAKVRVDKLDMELDINGECVLVKDPFALKADAKASAGKLSAVEMPFIFTNEDDKLVMYIGMDVLKKPVWLRYELGAAFDAGKIELQQAAAFFESAGNGLTLEQSEDENYLTLKIEAPAELIIGTAEEAAEKMQETVNIVVKIDKESYLPTEITAEIAPLVQFFLDRSGLNGSGLAGKTTVESAPVKLTLTGTDTVDSIDVPNDMCVVMDITPERKDKAPVETLIPEPAEPEPAESAETAPAEEPVPENETEEIPALFPNLYKEPVPKADKAVEDDKAVDAAPAEAKEKVPAEKEEPVTPKAEEPAAPEKEYPSLDELEEFYDYVLSWFLENDEPEFWFFYGGEA